jgi:ribosomal protein S14
MRFLGQIMGSVSASSRARQQRQSTGRRRSRIELGMDRLETRELLTSTNIPGVSLTYGNLLIQATKTSGNSAVVSIVNNNVQVAFNGYTQQFSQSLVFNMTYVGGSSGGDKFTNNTNIVSNEYGYGTGDQFTGGTGYNYAFFYGTGDTFTAQAGSVDDVFECGGPVTIINPNNKATVQVYQYYS